MYRYVRNILIRSKTNLAGSIADSAAVCVLFLDSLRFSTSSGDFSHCVGRRELSNDVAETLPADQDSTRNRHVKLRI